MKKRSELIEFVLRNDLQGVKDHIKDNPKSVLDVDPKSGKTALHYAAYGALTNMAVAILESPDVDFSLRDNVGRDALQAARWSRENGIADVILIAMCERAPELVTYARYYPDTEPD
jgi:hypothetical protein